MTESIKINNDTNYVSKLRKSSTSLTHLSKYPFLKEFGDLVLSVYAISYVSTLLSKLILDLKDGIFAKYTPFIIDWIEWIDKLNDVYILGNVDQYVPWISKLHLKDLYPKNVLIKIFNTGKEISGKYYKISVEKFNDFNNKLKPFIADKTNPLISPINLKISSIIDKYLSKTKDESSINSDLEFIKTYQLFKLSIQRTKPLILGKYEDLKQYPSKISSIYNDELTKNDKNIPKALANTSLEISNETLEKVGLKELKVPKIEIKIGKQDLSQVNGHVDTKTNGEISVGA